MGLGKLFPSCRYVWVLVIVVGVALAGTVVLCLSTLVFPHFLLGDFTVTFYRSANYALQGHNVYINSYPNPRDGREYPPYSPIWVVYHAVPLAGLSLHVAEALRFLLELVLVPFLALISARWAGLGNNCKIILLSIAPWFIMLVLAGQVSVLVYIGILLCYFGSRRADYLMIGVGLWLLLLKPHIGALVVLAVLLYAWRNRILIKSLAVLFGLAIVTSLAQPTWIGDLMLLAVKRLENPRILDSVLLLPGYPYAQLSLLFVSALLFALYFFYSRDRLPSKWLWSVLVTISLIAGLHTVPYDWLNLMLPLAILMRQRWGAALTIALYLYPLIWAAFLFLLDWHLLAPTIIPSVILGALFVSRYKQWAKALTRHMSSHAA